MFLPLCLQTGSSFLERIARESRSQLERDIRQRLLDFSPLCFAGLSRHFGCPRPVDGEVCGDPSDLVAALGAAAAAADGDERSQRHLVDEGALPAGCLQHGVI